MRLQCNSANGQRGVSGQRVTSHVAMVNAREGDPARQNLQNISSVEATALRLEAAVSSVQVTQHVNETLSRK